MSGEHDVTSVVGQMAGLSGDTSGERSLWPPDKLVRRFCGSEASGLVARPGTVTEDGIAKSSGWCGFTGARSDNALVSGFDDGYDFMGAMAQHGWSPISEKGDWPYVVCLKWNGAGVHALAEYCEADLTIWVCDTPELARSVYDGMRDIP